jgi:CRISPR-associated protein Csn2
LALPWDDKAFSGGLSARFERMVLEDEAARREIEEAFAILQSRLSRVALGFDSDYAFGIDWELKRYLRTYGFGVEIADDEPLIDKLIKFLMMARDASLKKALLFVNLKLFLTENEFDLFLEQALFSRLSVLLVENVCDTPLRPQERKYIIDQDLLESW